MVLMLANHYRLLAEKPISAEDFYGDDVRYSTEFEHLESELGKANSLHADQGPDWIVVRDGCELLLPALFVYRALGRTSPAQTSYPTRRSNLAGVAD